MMSCVDVRSHLVNDEVQGYPLRGCRRMAVRRVAVRRVAVRHVAVRCIGVTLSVCC